MKVRRERLVHPWSPEYSPFSQSKTGRDELLPPEPDRATMRRVRQREYNQRYYAAHKEQNRAYSRRYHWSHRQERSAYNHAYWQRPDVKQRDRDHDREQNSRIPLEIRSLQAREYEELMIRLRDEGYSWKQIAALTHHPIHSCQVTLRTGLKRRGIPTPTETGKYKKFPKRSEQKQHDALLLATYDECHSFAEVARRLGYYDHSPARNAYYRALERATRPEPSA